MGGRRRRTSARTFCVVPAELGETAAVPGGSRKATTPNRMSRSSILRESLNAAPSPGRSLVTSIRFGLCDPRSPGAPRLTLLGFPLEGRLQEPADRLPLGFVELVQAELDRAGIRPQAEGAEEEVPPG